MTNENIVKKVAAALAIYDRLQSLFPDLFDPVPDHPGVYLEHLSAALERIGAIQVAYARLVSKVEELEAAARKRERVFKGEVEGDTDAAKRFSIIELD